MAEINRSSFISLVRATDEEIKEKYKEIIDGQVIFDVTNKQIYCDEKDQRICYVGKPTLPSITKNVDNVDKIGADIVACADHAKDEYFYADGKLYKTKKNINKGENIQANNADEVTVCDEIGQINKRLTANNKDFNFAYDEATQRYGYKVGDIFNPFRPPHTETFKPSSRSVLDMGEDHAKRYVDTTAVPNNNYTEYNITSDGSYDLGAENTVRRVNVSSPMTRIYDSTTNSNGTTSWTATRKCFVICSAGTLMTNASSDETPNLISRISCSGQGLAEITQQRVCRANNGNHGYCVRIWAGVVNAGVTVTITSNSYGYGAGSRSIEAFAI